MLYPLDSLKGKVNLVQIKSNTKAWTSSTNKKILKIKWYVYTQRCEQKNMGMFVRMCCVSNTLKHLGFFNTHKIPNSS